MTRVLIMSWLNSGGEMFEISNASFRAVSMTRQSTHEPMTETHTPCPRAEDKSLHAFGKQEALIQCQH